MTKRRALVALLWAFAGGASAEWVPVHEGDGFTAYADRSTIAGDGGMVTMWDLIDLRSHQPSPLGNRHRSSLAKSEFDCANSRFRTLHFSLHADPMAGGEVVEATWDPENWLPITPGTLLKVLEQVACGGKPPP